MGCMRFRPISRIALCAVCSLLAAGFVGCSSTETFSEEDQTKAHLRQIAMAYTSTEKPPRDMEQLRSSVNDIHVLGVGVPPDEALVSPRDKQPIVVIFGVDGTDSEDSILAYEQQGADGKRWIVTMGGDVKQLTDEEFSKASFAHRHKPAAK